MLQCTSEGVYIRFPSQTLKLSNLDLNIYLPALNLINASYLIQTRAYGSRSDTIQKALLHKCFIEGYGASSLMKIQKVIKLICHVFKNTCAGSILAELAMLLHQVAQASSLHLSHLPSRYLLSPLDTCPTHIPLSLTHHLPRSSATSAFPLPP
jgi:hypothetical protein